MSPRLLEVRGNRHIGSGRYVRYSVTPLFAADTRLVGKASLSQWERPLGRFRFWNAMEYYYPYRNTNDENWRAVLAEFIPRFVAVMGDRDMGEIELGQVGSAVRMLRHTDGIILGLRGYPHGTAWRFAELLFPWRRQFSSYTTADSTFPGMSVWHRALPAGSVATNAGYYRGRIAIVVDERTQSQAEFSAMTFQTAPSTRVIGSQMAGADANIASIDLPGGVRAGFTGIGLYYPDGRETQHVGIVPDILARPTLNGVRSGRDDVLERAVAYVNTGR